MKGAAHYFFSLLAVLPVLCSGCHSKTFNKEIENLNKGELTLYADESYRGIVNELILSYENVYPESKITVSYGNDQEIVDAMLHDKTRMIITGRKLSEKEQQAIQLKEGIQPEQFIIATEAVAVIASREMTDSVFDLDEFMRSRQAGYSGRYKDFSFVFNKENSGMISQLLGRNGGSLNNMFSLENADTLIRYVSATKNAFGFISFAELSDTDEPNVKERLQEINIKYVGLSDSTGKFNVQELSQSSIAANEYPLQRQVTVVKGNVEQLLGTGFVNFMYRSKASRIMLKAGLVPAKMPERLIHVNQ